MDYLILAINPGSTSTKIAVYEDERQIVNVSIHHSDKELLGYSEVFGQYEFRLETVLKTLVENDININDITAIAAQGGLLPPIRSGAYEINDDMIWQLRYNPLQEHASILP